MTWTSLDNILQGPFPPGFMLPQEFAGFEGICLEYLTGLPAPLGDPIFNAEIQVFYQDL